MKTINVVRNNHSQRASRTLDHKTFIINLVEADGGEVSVENNLLFTKKREREREREREILG